MGEITRSAIEQIIEQRILHERDRAIMRRKMLDHITNERIAEELCISSRTVGNVVRRWGKFILKECDASN